MSESQKERVDRELIELLNEIRIALPGVQVLFAFLFTVPFSSRFSDLASGQLTTYFATFVVTILASACLMTPTSYHRIRFREGDKERMLRTANHFAIAGTALLAAAMAGATLLVADLLYGLATGAVVAGAVLGVLTWCWFGLPLVRRARDDDMDERG